MNGAGPLEVGSQVPERENGLKARMLQSEDPGPAGHRSQPDPGQFIKDRS